MSPQRDRQKSKEFKTQALILTVFVGIFWVVEIVDRFLFQNQLDQFGTSHSKRHLDSKRR